MPICGVDVDGLEKVKTCLHSKDVRQMQFMRISTCLQPKCNALFWLAEMHYRNLLKRNEDERKLNEDKVAVLRLFDFWESKMWKAMNANDKCTVVEWSLQVLMGLLLVWWFIVSIRDITRRVIIQSCDLCHMI